MMNIRLYAEQDEEALWAILKPIIRAGETYPIPRDQSREEVLAYWTQKSHETFIADMDGEILGTYYIRPNNQGGGAHIANCGYMTSPSAQGKGIARAMCAHSLTHARKVGYRGIQFNFVIANNQRAVALWHSFGFETLCTLPNVFDHPKDGMVDALVMFKTL